MRLLSSPLLLLLLSCAGEEASAPLPSPSQPQVLAQSDWWGLVSERIAAEGRAFRPEGSGFVAEIPGMPVRVGPRGLEAELGLSTLRLGLVAVGREGVEEDLSPAPVTFGDCTEEVDVSGACIPRLESNRPGIQEWWRSRRDGVEQGWTVEQPPTGVGPLALVMKVEGAEVEGEGELLRLVQGAQVLAYYRDIRAWDAEGRPLAAWMESGEGELRLRVEDRGARYPIAIDPVLSTAASTVDMSALGSFGASMANAGDLNGDGYQDVVVGAPSTNSSAGAAAIFLGSATGLQTAPSRVLRGATAGDGFGKVLAGGGDLNGDGYDDLAIGAPGYSSSTGQVSIFFGSATGISDTASTTLTGAGTGRSFGGALAIPGDYNRDGYDDLVVGAPTTSTNSGAVFTYRGSSTGPGSSADFSVAGSAGYKSGTAVTGGDFNLDGYADMAFSSPGLTSNKGRVTVHFGSTSGFTTGSRANIDGESFNDLFGTGLGSVDQNGDGYTDLLVGSPGWSGSTGKIYVFKGISNFSYASAGLATASQQGETVGDSFGSALVGVKDVTGDKIGEVAVGAPYYSASAGRAYLFYGSRPGGIGSGAAGNADLIVTGSVAASSLGSSLAGADTNPDPLGEWFVGASGSGQVQVFEGRTLGSLDATVDSTLSGTNQSNYLGAAVAGAGDVNQDGYGDVVVGAYGYNSSMGRVYLFHGSSGGLTSNPSTTLTGQTVGDQFGWSVSPAGDVNKDGYSDVIIGAPRYSSSKGRAYIYHGSSTGVRTTYTTVVTGSTAGDLLGTSVSGAGDVNNDRYSDVVMGAPGLSSAAGAAYVHHGSSTGVSTTIAATLSGSSGAAHGSAVAPGGDVNGDGYADVLVGAPSTSGNTGAVAVYQGSSTGVNLTAVLSLSGTAASGRYGTALAAGDVNGDGYSDVIVGAPGENSNSGALYVYSGSSGGVLATAATTLSGQSGAGLGTAVAAPGDLSGDGYDDVVVGAPLTSSSAGFAALFLGSSSGLSSSSSMSFSGVNSGDLLGQSVGGGDVNGDGALDILMGIPSISSGMGAVQVVHGAPGSFSSSASGSLNPGTSAQLGYALAGAGDVNQDGFEDVIVGAPGDWSSAGAAWIFHGSSSGMATSPATALYGYGSSAFGAAVAGVGDMNLDGYDDVAVGAPIESSGDGAVYVYAGSSRGVASGTPEIAALGLSGTGTFGAGVAGAGDVNDDGYADLVVGAGGYNSDQGAAYVYYGGTTGALSSTAAATLTGESSGDSFGGAVSGVGDLNGDGVDDLMVGAAGYGSGAGRAYVFLGSASGLSSMSAGSAAAILTGESSSAFGTSVAGAGDMDGDGDAEVVVGAPEWGSSIGRVYVFEGSSTGPSSRAASVADTVLTGQVVSSFGSKVLGLGDTNADGYTEIAVAASAYSSGAGRVYVYDGVAAGLSSGAASSVVLDGSTGAGFGASLGAADVNGDNLADLLAGANTYSSSVGRAFVYLGYAADNDGDGYSVGTDCNDADPAINPAAAEVCDAAATDEDCDGLVDDADPGLTGASAWYRDVDADGFGDLSTAQIACAAPTNFVALGTDCNDGNAAVSPAATEVCDAANTDEDCDGQADDADSSVLSSTQTTWYRDADGDSYGDPAFSRQACDAASGSSANALDCDDSNAAIRPGAAELCDANNVDEDCNGLADNADPNPQGTSSYYGDADGDGYGDPAVVQSACDAGTGRSANNQDCNDSDASISPVATEVCDSANTDEDCDALADDLDSSAVGKSAWYADSDGDGYAGAGSSVQACDAPAGRYSVALDCDDSDPAISPAAAEVCDAADEDEDCDGRADDADSSVSGSGSQTFYADADGDGYGDVGSPVQGCDAPAGTVSNNQDCNDAFSNISPAAPELCDPNDIDEDCDGLSDSQDPGATGTFDWYADQDGDGAGAGSPVASSCDPPTGSASRDDDCDDNDAGISPLVEERCDVLDVDEDCDGLSDDADPSAQGQGLWYADRDVDGYGNPGELLSACDAPTGYVYDSQDCDDLAPGVHPGATEVCDGADQDEDCDGLADDLDIGVDPTTYQSFYRDADGDGYGDPSVLDLACDPGAGVSSYPTDCDDGDAALSPDAQELCDPDDIDEDCDGNADNYDSSAVGANAWYRDSDSDGYGDTTSATDACDAPIGMIATGGDCNDGNAAISPDMEELCDVSNIDEDCDGAADDLDTAAVGTTTWFQDSDGDGYGDINQTITNCDGGVNRTDVGGDCNDTSNLYYPSATETCADTVDFNCDGAIGAVDADGDGYAACQECDDTDPAVNPAATEYCDRTDNDCNGMIDDLYAADVRTWYQDIDEDGYGNASVTFISCAQPVGYVDISGDCADTDTAYNPGVTEVCTDTDDYDCDGFTPFVDSDGDGFASCDECDDGEPTTYPGASESCDGIDNDCDGTADEGVVVTVTWYLDADGDGHGVSTETVLSCTAPVGYTSLDDDCNDGDPATYPGAAELCDGTDQDCDSVLDNVRDADGDGYDACSDCDDGDSDSYPGAAESCDGLDNNCNGLLDEGAQSSGWFPDADGDGFGNSVYVDDSCQGPAGWINRGGDCDDLEATVYPEAPEDCLDGLDTDCDGVSDAEESICAEEDSGDSAVDSVDSTQDSVGDSVGDSDKDSQKGGGEEEPTCGCGGGEAASLVGLGLLGGLWRRRRK